ncbi:glutathione S-transferase [Aspergillus cavernicola]|uniref:glutathione transferase n=1 Tax=Aspergillus cavernicola TaxID=176166 RepID=A0ABR4I4U5_9EURO
MSIQVFVVPINVTKGEHTTSLFVAECHPFGKIPVFKQGNTQIFESRAIWRYLAAKYQADLGPPANPDDLATFEQLDSVGYSHFDPAISGLAYGKLFKRARGNCEPNPKRIQELEEQVSQCLDYYDGVLTKQAWFAGDNFSVIDICNIPMLEMFITRLGYEHEVTSRLYLKAWWNRATKCLSWKAIKAKASG